jgi:hypothetical protein
VPAARQPLTTDPASPVSHDTEVMALAGHGGRLFAATDQWEYPGSPAYGQVLVKDAAAAPWRVFEGTQSLRVQAIDSFPIPADQGLGPGHSLLVTHAVVDGQSRIQWLLDGAPAFAPADSYVLPSHAAVRSFGAHESDGAWAVYAGAEPTGVLRGTWSRDRHTLVFDPMPELTAASPAAPGLKTQKVTGFAECGGAAYVTVNTTLYRRDDDGAPPAAAARWSPVYREPPVGPFNSGLRGLSCVRHAGAPALLASTEGDGDVYRFDHLPTGRVAPGPAPAPGRGGDGVVPVLEFEPVPTLRALLARQSTPVPTSGPGSINYVIAAYNEFRTISLDGADRQVFGIEHAYRDHCPPTRTCGPTGFGAAAYDAAAVFAVRTDTGGNPSYALRTLTGPDFGPAGSPRTPGSSGTPGMSGSSGTPGTPGSLGAPGAARTPIRPGQAFVAIRTIQPSPFADGRLYFAGYDDNFYPADGTAWVASSAPGALSLDDTSTGAPS